MGLKWWREMTAFQQVMLIFILFAAVAMLFGAISSPRSWSVAFEPNHR